MRRNIYNIYIEVLWIKVQSSIFGTIVAPPPTRHIGWMKPCQERMVVNMPLLSLTTPCLLCSHLITESEAIMKSMDHPNIIKLFETFEDRKHIYLVAWQSNDITSNQNVMTWWCRVTWGKFHGIAWASEVVAGWYSNIVCLTISFHRIAEMAQLPMMVESLLTWIFLEKKLDERCCD